jgi:hypothetical protein
MLEPIAMPVSYFFHGLEPFFDLNCEQIGESRTSSLHRKRTAWRQQDYQEPQLWWHRIVPSHKVVMDWKMSPSHNLGAQLEDVWFNR